MTDSIVKMRERLVELSTDPIETRKILDQLTEEEIDQANIESPFHVGKNDIIETKDLEYAKIHRINNGYVIHYHGGYSILINDKLLTTCSAAQSLLEGVPSYIKDANERESIEITNSAIDTIFRLPMFVFSNGGTTFTIAEAATRYMLLLQKTGEVPTPNMENPEFDKFIVEMNKLMENFAKGLEKQGLEYEKRMGYAKEEEQSQGKNQGQGEGKAE